MIKVEKSDVHASSRILALDQNIEGNLDPKYLYLFSPPPHPAVAGAINGPNGNYIIN